MKPRASTLPRVDQARRLAGSGRFASLGGLAKYVGVSESTLRPGGCASIQRPAAGCRCLRSPVQRFLGLASEHPCLCDPENGRAKASYACVLSGRVPVRAYTAAVDTDTARWPTKADLLDIKAKITDAEALAMPSPERMRSYLQYQGWALRTDDGETPEVWALAASEGIYEILLPSSKKHVDFPRCVSELLRTLSIVEDRSELALWHDLVSPPRAPAFHQVGWPAASAHLGALWAALWGMLLRFRCRRHIRSAAGDP